MFTMFTTFTLLNDKLYLSKGGSAKSHSIPPALTPGKAANEEKKQSTTLEILNCLLNGYLKFLSKSFGIMKKGREPYIL